MVMLNSYKRQCNWAEAGCGQRQKHSFRRSASLPPQHAQHRRALGTPVLRAGLRRKEGRSLFRYPALTSQRVRKRPRWLDPFASLRAGCTGLLYSALPGWLTGTRSSLHVPWSFWSRNYPYRGWLTLVQG